VDPKEKIIVSLDVENFEKAKKIVNILQQDIEIFKIGIVPFTGFGQQILEFLHEKKKKVFLDLKFHDIPNTVRNAVRAACAKNVFMMNFHCAGGASMLEAAAGAVRDIGTGNKPLLIGVTVLTSMSPEDIEKIGMRPDVEEQVLRFAKMAGEAGLDGVVASPREARDIKNKMGKDFIVVTPGVRPGWAAQGDQKRVLTPGAAIEAGADYLVVGRPVIQAQDPGAAVKKIIEEISSIKS
jgi:orotidine-5'-phosphate decarboxylase